MFGVQFYGECYSSENAESNYDKYGKSKNCINGVGKHWTNFVYRMIGGFFKRLYLAIMTFLISIFKLNKIQASYLNLLKV